MRQLVQLEGSNWCGAITACMVLDHFGRPWDLNLAKRRFAELNGQCVEDYGGAQDIHMASFLAEQGMVALYVTMGLPLVKPPDSIYSSINHLPRENRVATWFRVHDLIRCGYVAVVGVERDAGKGHFVCVDDAFIRAGEHWFSLVDPIRGAFEEQAERFLLTVDGKGNGHFWTFARPAHARFASAAAAAQSETEERNP